MKPQRTRSEPPAGMAKTPHILVLHGPNLNLLGMREPLHYGSETLADIDARLQARARQAEVTLECLQSNSEAVLIERIHAAWQQSAFIIINPAAFTHTSIALRDALSAVAIPFIEVHLSNVHAREAFRQHSYFSDVAVGVISGLGAQGYQLALDYALSQLTVKA
jgi:3-dehydroquinate dehydratase-2